MTSTMIRPPQVRVEGPEKVTGAAKYAYEHEAKDDLYAWPVTATAAAGAVETVDVEWGLAQPGVVAVYWHGNAPARNSTGDPFADQLQSPDVHFRGEIVALVVAESSEYAREAAEHLPVTYSNSPASFTLGPDDDDLYVPEQVNPAFPAETLDGDPETNFASSPVQVDAVYRTSPLQNMAMEPHATTAVWDGQAFVIYDSNQHGHGVRQTISTVFGLPLDAVRVINTHVGGGFGSKGTTRPTAVLAAMAAKELNRPVHLSLTRQHMFDVVGYRTPTIQQIRLGAGEDGRLRSIDHDVVEQTAVHFEFGEQTAVPTRMMYAAPHRRTRHRLGRRNLPVPSWMRAPGECPGMFALETAMDELAVATGLDPIELRIRNEPTIDPDTGNRFSSRNLVGCLHRGADLFGWADRPARPGSRRRGDFLIGMGVAAATYPAMAMPASATATAEVDGTFTVAVNGADIGTGARTALRIIAAEALGLSDVEQVDIRIGDTDFPEAGVAGGSSGTSSWGWAVTKAAQGLRARLEGRELPSTPVTVTADISSDIEQQAPAARHAFGAQFAQVRVDTVTGEIRVERMLGVFAAGRIINPSTARSQFLGGMTMGLGMALLEGSELDVEFGNFANHDLATYHVAACADVPAIEVDWLDERDDDLNPMGTKGIGEIGIVGAAAAIGNAVYNATGVRVRSLPITLEDVGVL